MKRLQQTLNVHSFCNLSTTVHKQTDIIEKPKCTQMKR
ncbi:hypothetical protein BDL97_10G097500 [Sphagnum fallax]|nr:hypothetical protein BDL97_10G097500 [Sphagnum fallax]